MEKPKKKKIVLLGYREPDYINFFTEEKYIKKEIENFGFILWEKDTRYYRLFVNRLFDFREVCQYIDWLMTQENSK